MRKISFAQRTGLLQEKMRQKVKGNWPLADRRVPGWLMALARYGCSAPPRPAGRGGWGAWGKQEVGIYLAHGVTPKWFEVSP
jgi:hypothetical protein